MKNIKLALLCLALSNIIFIQSMEEQEEEKYSLCFPDYLRQTAQTETVQQDHMFDAGEEEKEDEYQAIDDTQKNNHKLSFEELLKQFNSLSFSQDSQTSHFSIIEDYFKSTDDIYNALAQSFEYIGTIDENFGSRFKQKINRTTKEIIHFIVKKISLIEDINPLFHQAVQENNDAIKAVLICSRIDVRKFSANEFYKKIFKRIKRGFRAINEENKVMFPYLSNAHKSSILPILKLQKETSYPLLNLGDTLIGGFLNGNKEIINYIILNDLAPMIAPIFQAALLGNSNYLEQASFDIDQIDPVTGLSLLSFAAIGDNIEIAKLLIQKGANIELGNPLHVAAFFGSADIVILLIKMGANINSKCGLQFFKDYRPIDMSLSGRHREIAQFLFKLELESGMPISDKDQQNSFQHALSSEDKDIAEMLLRSYPQCFPSFYLSKSPYPSKLTPLHIAAQYNWIKLATILVNAGALLNARTSKYGNTALHIAAELGHNKIVKLLLDSDAQPNVKNCNGRIAMDLAKLTFTFGETRRERMNAARTFQLLYNSNKEVINPQPEPDDLAASSNFAIDKKRRLSSVSLRSSSSFIQNKKQKTKLTKKLQPTEIIKALKDYNF